MENQYYSAVKTGNGIENSNGNNDDARGNRSTNDNASGNGNNGNPRGNSFTNDNARAEAEANRFTLEELINISKNGIIGVEHELEQNFTQRKQNNLLVSDSYRRLGLDDTADKLRGCATLLKYRLDHHNLNSHGYQKLASGMFCSNVLCPVCQWRKSRKRQNQLLAIMNRISRYRFIFLTLTMENVEANGLRKATDKMLRHSWNYLTNHKRFKAAVMGYYRTFEITHDTD